MKGRRLSVLPLKPTVITSPDGAALFMRKFGTFHMHVSIATIHNQKTAGAEARILELVAARLHFAQELAEKLCGKLNKGDSSLIGVHLHSEPQHSLLFP